MTVSCSRVLVPVCLPVTVSSYHITNPCAGGGDAGAGSCCWFPPQLGVVGRPRCPAGGGGRDAAGGARAGAAPSLPRGYALFISRPSPAPAAAPPSTAASAAAPPAPEGRSRVRGRSSAAAWPRALSGQSGFLGAVPGRPRQRRREGLGVARRPSPAIGAWRCGAAPGRPDAPRPCAAPQVPERAESGRAGGGAVWGSR